VILARVAQGEPPQWVRCNDAGSIAARLIQAVMVDHSVVDSATKEVWGLFAQLVSRSDAMRPIESLTGFLFFCPPTCSEKDAPGACFAFSDVDCRDNDTRRRDVIEELRVAARLSARKTGGFRFACCVCHDRAKRLVPCHAAYIPWCVRSFIDSPGNDYGPVTFVCASCASVNRVASTRLLELPELLRVVSSERARRRLVWMTTPVHEKEGLLKLTASMVFAPKGWNQVMPDAAARAVNSLLLMLEGQSSICWWCGDFGGTKKKSLCSGCRAATYCDSECFSAGWKEGGHREVCCGKKA
jgi:hypothetical protein